MERVATTHCLDGGGNGGEQDRYAGLAGTQQPDNLRRICLSQTLHVGNAAGCQRAGEDYQADTRHAQRRWIDTMLAG